MMMGGAFLFLWEDVFGKLGRAPTCHEWCEDTGLSREVYFQGRKEVIAAADVLVLPNRVEA